MTSIPSTSQEQLAGETKESRFPRSSQVLNDLFRRLDIWIELIGDRVNPILVKETRQALKSRQFVIVFLVVLIAAWIASFAVVAIVGPSVYYGAEGASMLMVYCTILAFPLMLIVPFTAYRSLATEQEDNTYELLSISTLSTGQIVRGKLCSAAVQMLIYLSAVSPCIAFTFLLRGVDALTVIVLLAYYILTSLGLSMIALLAGTVAKVRYTQALLSVLLVVCLVLVFISAIGLTYEFIQDSYLVLRDPWFWVGNLAFLTFYLTTFALVHAAAAAQIAFNSENRSTPLRRLMILQQACFLGWMMVPTAIDGVTVISEIVLIIYFVLGIYWYVMGTMLTSEWPYLSRRVQRSLPQTKAGRVLLTWFNPGPGTGFVFSIANLTFVGLLGLFVEYFFAISSRGLTTEKVVYFLVLGWCHVVVFLGLGRLLISFIRRFIYVSMTAGFLFHMILLLLAAGVPQILAFMTLPQQYSTDYSLLHMTNPIWTLYALGDDGPNAIDAFVQLWVLIPAAVIVLMLNMRTVAAEVQYQRRMLPTRVAEEEAELHPVPETKPTNPWEDV